MGKFLTPDNPVMNFITRIAYTVWLNILWFICCIPIVTVGASTTALFYVTLKMVKNEEGNITQQFFRSFRQNFKQSTIVWLIMLALGLVLALDGYVLYHMHYSNAFWTIITAIYFVVLAAYAIITMYIYPLMARFDNTIRMMFFNSIMIGMRFLLCTVLMAAIYFLMVVIIVRFFTPMIAFGEGLCAFLCSYFLKNILELCETKEEERTKKEEAEQEKEEIEEGYTKTTDGTAGENAVFGSYWKAEEEQAKNPSDTSPSLAESGDGQTVP